MLPFLKAHYRLLVELVVVVVLLGGAALSVVAGWSFRLRWAGFLAFLLSGAALLPVLLLMSEPRLHNIVILLGLAALLLGVIGCWVGMKSVSSPPPPERRRRRKRKTREPMKPQP